MHKSIEAALLSVRFPYAPLEKHIGGSRNYVQAPYLKVDGRQVYRWAEKGIPAGVILPLDQQCLIDASNLWGYAWEAWCDLRAELLALDNPNTDLEDY